MADALSAIPAAVLRNLADKLYEKRKNAALEVYPFCPLILFSVCSILGVYDYDYDYDYGFVCRLRI